MGAAKVTYITLTADNEELHAQLEAAAGRVHGALGERIPIVVGPDRRFTDRTIESVSPADTGEYDATVANDCGTKQSASAHLAVDDCCYPDYTDDGTLDLFDFLTFVNLFNASDPAVDCDASGSLDLFDFLCFTNAFNAGC